MFYENGYYHGGTPEAPVLEVTTVVEAKPLKDYRLWLRFQDGAKRIYDVTPLLDKPVFKPLKEPMIFDSVYIDECIGTVVWQNGTIDIAPETLYARGIPVEA